MVVRSCCTPAWVVGLVAAFGVAELQSVSLPVYIVGHGSDPTPIALLDQLDAANFTRVVVVPGISVENVSAMQRLTHDYQANNFKWCRQSNGRPALFAVAQYGSLMSVFNASDSTPGPFMMLEENAVIAGDPQRFGIKVSILIHHMAAKVHRAWHALYIGSCSRTGSGSHCVQLAYDLLLSRAQRPLCTHAIIFSEEGKELFRKVLHNFGRRKYLGIISRKATLKGSCPPWKVSGYDTFVSNRVAEDKIVAFHTVPILVNDRKGLQQKQTGPDGAGACAEKAATIAGLDIRQQALRNATTRAMHRRARYGQLGGRRYFTPAPTQKMKNFFYQAPDGDDKADRMVRDSEQDAGDDGAGVLGNRFGRPFTFHVRPHP